MTESKRPLKVFLCHAHADRDAVKALYTRLTQDGVDAWLDKEKLLPGQDWELEIRKTVREADVVVVCLSKQFNQAGFRQKEVRLALDTAMEQPEGEIFIIPARLEVCDTLESLRKWHWVDLFEEDGYEALVRALQKRAGSINRASINDQVAARNVVGEIKTHIKFGLYSEAYKKCLHLLSKEGDNALINVLAGIAYILDKGENHLRDSDMQIIDNHIADAILNSKLRPTALAILGCVKYNYYYLNKIYDPSHLTLEFVKEELKKNLISIDDELLNLISPTENALSFLGII